MLGSPASRTFSMFCLLNETAAQFKEKAKVVENRKMLQVSSEAIRSLELNSWSRIKKSASDLERKLMTSSPTTIEKTRPGLNL